MRQCNTLHSGQPLETLKLISIKDWRDVKTPEIEAAVCKGRPEDRLELLTAASRQFCSTGMR